MSKNFGSTHPITLIAAMGLDRTIGLNNQMPWHLPEDLRFFKARTIGKTLIMGKNTFDSIGKPLPGRKTIIVSRSLKPDDLQFPECSIAASLDQAFQLAQDQSIENQEIIVAGGGQIYQQSLPFADRLVITEIQQAYDGDTFFPGWNKSEWTLVSRENHQQTQKPYLSYSFLEYHRSGRAASN